PPAAASLLRGLAISLLMTCCVEVLGRWNHKARSPNDGSPSRGPARARLLNCLDDKEVGELIRTPELLSGIGSKQDPDANRIPQTQRGAPEGAPLSNQAASASAGPNRP
uniref:hypothetical protein n=1 Tax=Roseivivax marinus TaxID=1379903 RepID=UPI00273E9575